MVLPVFADVFCFTVHCLTLIYISLQYS